MRADLPTGTVTFLFTDIEGSTRLLHALGADGYANALAEHRRVLREAFTSHGGVEIDTQGDAFFVAFSTAHGAASAAVQGVEALATGPIRSRMGLHTGTPTATPEGYVGVDVHRGARVGALAHGGQVVLSPTAAALLEAHPLVDLGLHRLKEFYGATRLCRSVRALFLRCARPGASSSPCPRHAFSAVSRSSSNARGDRRCDAGAPDGDDEPRAAPDPGRVRARPPRRSVRAKPSRSSSSARKPFAPTSNPREWCPTSALGSTGCPSLSSLRPRGRSCSPRNSFSSGSSSGSIC